MITKKIRKPRQVLVVDDQELNRDILGALLEEDYDVLYAADGIEALAVIRENLDTLSIVMLDVFMPRMNGFEVLRRMKDDEQMETIPVIVLTADKSMELKALQLGAADFITKPFDLQEVILARVGRIIELSEGRRLISSAEHDRLTMLYSRNFFFEYAERLFTYHAELRMDAVTVDVDQFHSLNDLSGREFGDEVLRRVGGEIRAFLTETEGIAARPEADHFLIYCVPQGDYRALLDRLQRAVDELAPAVSVRLRMGVKPWSEGEGPRTMFEQAQRACAMARGDYHTPIRTYDEEMHRRELRDQRLINDLRAALEQRQFKVFYQPKYNVQCDPPRLNSAEALIRWQHPELGMIPPGEFIPLFERKGFISAVDEFVWQEAAAQIARWKKRYGFTLPVSVNLSRADVLDPTLIDRLTKLVKDNGLTYEDVNLEVTESAYTDNAKQLLDVVAGLRKLGFEIEMDDFGSGYSSLNMISTMPVDVLKMDMSFVRNIEHNPTDRHLVELILGIAKYLGVPVVAEGVETQGQLDILRTAGCDLVQGYYFSRPVPAEEFEPLIQKESEMRSR